MHLTDETVARLAHEDVRTTECLALNALRIDRLGASLLSCRRVVSIDLSGNALRSVAGGPFRSCVSLWWINLSKNQLTTLEDSGLVGPLGEVDISDNDVSRDGLRSVAALGAVRLHLKGNPRVLQADRDELLRSPAAPWVLDDVYEPERGASVHAVVRASEKKAGDGDRRNGVDEGWMRQRFYAVLAEQPRRPVERDHYRRAVALSEYHEQATLQARWVSQRRYKTPPPRSRPCFDQTVPLEAPVETRLDLCVLFGVFGGVAGLPRQMLEEALREVLSSSREKNTAGVSEALAAQPSFVLTGLASVLRKTLLDGEQHLVDASRHDILNALPHLFQKNSSVLVRRAVLLLSRVPCWPRMSGLSSGLAAKVVVSDDKDNNASHFEIQTTGVKSKRHDAPSEAVVALLNAARLSAEDCTRILESSARSTERGGSRARWHYREPPLREGPTMATLRAPKPGEFVEVTDGVFAVVVDVVDDSVLVSAFPGLDLPPFNSDPLIERRWLMWDPRGWWRYGYAVAVQAARFHVERRCRLFPANRGLNGSGRPRAAGQLNVPVPDVAVRATADRLNAVSVYAASEATDPAFVVASPCSISAQNARAPPSVQAWARIESPEIVPVATSPLSPLTQRPPLIRVLPSEDETYREAMDLVVDRDVWTPQAWHDLQRDLGSHRLVNKQVRKHCDILRRAAALPEKNAATDARRPPDGDVDPSTVFQLTEVRPSLLAHAQKHPSKRTESATLRHSKRKAKRAAAAAGGVNPRPTSTELALARSESSLETSQRPQLFASTSNPGFFSRQWPSSPGVITHRLPPRTAPPSMTRRAASATKLDVRRTLPTMTLQAHGSRLQPSPLDVPSPIQLPDAVEPPPLKQPPRIAIVVRTPPAPQGSTVQSL